MKQLIAELRDILKINRISNRKISVKVNEHDPECAEMVILVESVDCNCYKEVK